MTQRTPLKGFEFTSDIQPPITSQTLQPPYNHLVSVSHFKQTFIEDCQLVEQVLAV